MEHPLFANLVAYIDPGSGAIILQLVIAFILAVSIYLRRFLITPIQMLWWKIRGVSAKPQDEDESPAS